MQSGIWHFCFCLYRLLLLACCFVSVCFFVFFFMLCAVKWDPLTITVLYFLFPFIAIPSSFLVSPLPYPKQGLPHSVIPPLPKRPALEKANGATTMFNASMLQYQQALANMQFQQQAAFIPSGKDPELTWAHIQPQSEQATHVFVPYIVHMHTAEKLAMKRCWPYCICIWGSFLKIQEGGEDLNEQHDVT